MKPMELIRNRRLRKRRLRKIVVLLSALSVLQVASAGTANAQTGTPADWVIDPIGDLVGGGIGAVAEKVANTIFEKVFAFVSGLIADAVMKATELLISVFDAIDVRVGADGTLTGAVSSKLHLQMVALGGFLVTLLFLVRLASALIHRQMGQVARELFFDLPITIIGTAAAGAVGFILLQVSNEMAASFSQDFATNIGAFSGQFFTKDALVTGGIFSVLFAIIYIVGAVLVGLELIVRASLLTVVFAVAPVMVATRTWEGTRRYSRRFIEVSLALLFAKPAAAFALALGSAQLADPGNGNDVVKVLLGTTITVMAAYMPFALFKLIPIVEGAAVQQGVKGAPVRVAQAAFGMAASAALIAGGGGGSAGTAAGGGAGGGAGAGGGSGLPGGSGGSAPPSGGGLTPTAGSNSSAASQAAPGDDEGSRSASWSGPNSARVAPPISRGSRGAALSVANRVVGSVPTQSQQVVSADAFFGYENSDDDEGGRV